ncbi:hypothetical Protein YC6258_03194 [Gynuella sunshinyii YC6258]|uniref:Uncharacterized protein n=1 Tax=Gynuella sunshinyii YC6258 TaxID=1445510 RepID=A0A0C5V745_9GAMM|nr:hypothetical Protein YC6258_03194 [Gynuella sunshinyii YC6258]
MAVANGVVRHLGAFLHHTINLICILAGLIFTKKLFLLLRSQPVNW